VNQEPARIRPTGKISNPPPLAALAPCGASSDPGSELSSFDLLGILGHDLLNPIGNIQTATDLLLDGCKGPLNPDQKSLVELLQRSASFASNLIQEIMEMIRTHSRSFVLEPRRLDLRDRVRDAVVWTSWMAAEKQVTVIVDVPDTPVWAMIDEERMIQVLVNLLVNSIKFSQPKSSVEICAYPDEDRSVVRIRDHGCGIRRDEIGRLFRKFSRSSSHPSGGEPSTGLGLYIVNEIVKLHDGSVLLDASDEGCTFWVRLPAADVD